MHPREGRRRRRIRESRWKVVGRGMDLAGGAQGSRRRQIGLTLSAVPESPKNLLFTGYYGMASLYKW